MKILIIEPDSVEGDALRSQLSAEPGIQVILESKAAAALATHKNESPDVVVADAGMTYGGEFVITLMKTQSPQIPVIAVKSVSAKSDESVIKNSNLVMIRPFKPEELLTVIVRLITMAKFFS